ncbi:enoyl-CoA hydratase [Sphingobium sp. OAS761]|uniref:enoyl-CoA hydratase-related protein n=1 Tax=Sphingobium sp. OAS761 TaxID=2817901 RepID=UPI0020A152C1|nr:enoyl-CoA hydratase-related protein [Sphingobium sp. OAS761]MCP1472422.1 enoyl-CoA hydratase [Sphingobium sp. OAS761]
MSEPTQHSPVLIVNIEGPVAVVTINRPEVMNSLSRAVFEELEAAFAGFGEEVLVAVLTGAGERAFCAGIDMKELASGEGISAHSDATIGFGHTRFGLAAFNGVVIGAINGVAVAGGLELALCCDIRIASTTARFGDVHSRVGLLPGALLSSLLPHLIGVSRAKEMALSSRLIDAATAERWGLVNRLAEPGELLDTAMALAHDIAKHDRKIIRAYNALIDENYGMTYKDSIDNEFRVSQAFEAQH